VKINRVLRRKACRFVGAAGIFTFGVFGHLQAIPEDDSDSLLVPEVSNGIETAPVENQIRLTLGGGLFLPVGKWSEGFDPGISLGMGVDFPIREALEVGGRFSKVELKMDNQATLDWLSMEVQVSYFPPVDFSHFDFYLAGRSGLLRAVFEVGEGREDEWDLSDDFNFQGIALWQKVFAEAAGFYFGGGLSFYLP
jgi:hypothetical protein